MKMSVAKAMYMYSIAGYVHYECVQSVYVHYEL